MSLRMVPFFLWNFNSVDLRFVVGSFCLVCCDCVVLRLLSCLGCFLVFLWGWFLGGLCQCVRGHFYRLFYHQRLMKSYLLIKKKKYATTFITSSLIPSLFQMHRTSSSESSSKLYQLNFSFGTWIQQLSC